MKGSEIKRIYVHARRLVPESLEIENDKNYNLQVSDDGKEVTIYDGPEKVYPEKTPVERELELTDALLEENRKVLAAIPECPIHGPCIPHALEWIEQAKAYNAGFYPMQEHPKKVNDFENISVDVLVFDFGSHSFCELGFYNFDTGLWSHYGASSMELICWCYVPDPTNFLKGKDLIPVTHTGYQA